VFAFASNARSEAFGVAQVEAMAAGKPVVNTDLPSGVPFVSPHKMTGLTVPAGDANALANAVGLLLESQEHRRMYGQAALQRARAMFTAEVMMAQTLEMYREILGVREPVEVEAPLKVRAVGGGV
jgi:rhamnosyl/mannosyltransferase